MKLTIFYTTEKDNNWLAFVWFKCTNASSEDFNQYVICSRLIRQKSKWKMVYDDLLKANTIETSVPEKTVEYIKDAFWNLFRNRFKSLEIVEEKQEIKRFDNKDITNIQENIDFSPIENQIRLIEDTYLNESFKLKKHQKEWLFFTVKNKKVYLAFEPGTWKSLIFFSTILFLHKYRWLKNFVVIWPAAYWASRNLYEEFKSYMNENSKESINLHLFNWSKLKKFNEFIKNKKDINILIVSYETIRWKSLNDILDWTKNLWKFEFLWCDEAKALMNHESKQSQAIRKLVEKNNIEYIQFWEWTPIRWFADDLWNPLDILQTWEWWNYWSFRNRFCILKDINIWMNRTIKMVTWTQNWIELHNRLKWLMLTKKLDDLWDVPEVIFSKIFVDITNTNHKKLLKKITEDYIEWYKEYKESKWESTKWINRQSEENNKLTQVLRLYQWTTIPTLLDESIWYEDIEQIQVLKEFVEESILWNKKKVVIFTKFRESAKAISEVLQNLLNSKRKKWDNIEQKVINYSEYSSSQKIEQVKLFQNDEKYEYPIFVSTIDWGWASITLTKSSVLVFYEKPFTWAEVKQALRRVQRISQKEKVRIISIVAKWTICEKIEKKIMNKKESSDIIMDWKIDKLEEDINDWIENFIFDLESLKID